MPAGSFSADIAAIRDQARRKATLARTPNVTWPGWAHW
jgi:hypothetical protein